MKASVYVLVKGTERIEVIPGREDKRDRLIAAGYEWVNQQPKPKPKRGKRIKMLDVRAVDDPDAPTMEELAEAIAEDADN